ncbi:MAG: hypothetical protein AAGI12_15350 [Pseudomonadota bacterium]
MSRPLAATRKQIEAALAVADKRGETIKIVKDGIVFVPVDSGETRKPSVAESKEVRF